MAAFRAQLFRRCVGVLAFMLAAPPYHACAAQDGIKPTPMITGALGLNTVPNARMDPAGTVRASVGTADPFIHSTLGVQVTDPLWIGIRHTSEISSLRDDAKRLMPGVDLKLRLRPESAYKPAVSLGFQSAFGHKRMAGEYVVVSKRFDAIDISGGIGWGVYGSADHVKNPFPSIFSSFERKRDEDGESPSTPADWFAGKAGFFAGFDYQTPIDSVTVKADFSADESQKSPWSVSVNYTPRPWISASVGAIGTDTVMARLSLSGVLSSWPWRAGEIPAAIAMQPYRAGAYSPQDMVNEASRHGYAMTAPSGEDKAARVSLKLDAAAPLTIGQALRAIANHAGHEAETLSVAPSVYGLKGPVITVARRDLEQMSVRQQGSVEEIWRNTDFNLKTPRTDLPFEDRRFLRLMIDEQASLSEEDSGILHRTAIIGEYRRPVFASAYGVSALRLNLFSNLDELNDYRLRSLAPVRGDVDLFARRGIAVDRMYVRNLYSFTPEWHTSVMTGYVEEMYSATGGEVLYRPFGKTWAMGADAYIAAKRDPATAFNLGLAQTAVLTGHVTGYYEWQDEDITLSLSAGRYLAGDMGATFQIDNRFMSGAKLSAFITATNAQDLDAYGAKSNFYSGLSITVPFGSVPYMPDGSSARLSAVPFGRNTGQKLDIPERLHDVSEPLSYRHLVRHWGDLKAP